MLGLIGKKIGMTQIFDQNGNVIPVTAIQVGPCTVLEVKEKEKNGYNALKLGFEDIKEQKINKPQSGYFERLNEIVKEINKDIKISPKKYIREFKLAAGENKYSIGEDLTVEFFENVKFVDVSGKSKGKGFAGVIKRYNEGRGRMSHGSKFHRAPGSTGQCVSPSRVHKNRKMPGHLGNEKVTVQNLEVVKVIKEKNILLVKGAIPGTKNSLVIVKKAVKKS